MKFNEVTLGKEDKTLQVRVKSEPVANSDQTVAFVSSSVKMGPTGERERERDLRVIKKYNISLLLTIYSKLNSYC